MFSNKFKPKFFTIFLLLSTTNFLPILSESKTCRIIIRDQLAHPHNTRADQQISDLTKLSSCEILKLSSFQKPDTKRPNYWTYTTVLDKVSEKAPDWTLFVEPHSILTVDNLKEIFELSDDLENAENTPIVYTNELIDKDLSIIHHFAGYKPEEAHKKSFIDFARGFLVNKIMLEKLSKYQSTTSQNSQSFHIDAAHELSEYIDKALESDENGMRKWLKHSEVFKNIKVKKFSEYNCGSKITEDDFMIAVKTAKHLHKDRLKIVLDTWGLEFKNIKFFSNVSTSLFNGEIETTNTYNVPNTLRGHCGKTSAIIKNFDNVKYKFLVIVDDDTIFGKEQLMKILNCYKETENGVFIGERYGFALGNKYSGYNYITGGGGMILSSKGAKVYKDKCECPSIESPDDMMISECLERNGVHMVHEPAFHQARPEDYTRGYLEAHGAVSFHKHWNCDPKAIYEEWFSKNKHDEL